MNWLKKGPELKLPEAKIPDFLYDLYYDLKERHLLPLVAVLAISIVVVPLALSQTTGSDSGEEEAAVATPSIAAPKASTLTVAKSAPGLREYRRRLRYARALDPFRESSDAAAAGASAAGESAAAPETVEATSAPVEVPTESSSTPSYPIESVGAESTAGGKTQTKFASNTLDVRIVAVPEHSEDARTSAKPKPQTRRNLPELTMLPSRQAPVAIFMGTSSDGKKALLLVSSDVQSIFGDGQCIVGSQTCQLLALEAGVPETFVYGPQARTYRIEILKVSRELTNKPRRASLGAKKREGPKAGRSEAEVAPRVSSAQPR